MRNVWLTWAVDQETSEETWSDEHFRIFGYEPGEVEPTLDMVINSVHPDDRETLVKLQADEKSSDISAYTHEYRIVRPDGSERFLVSSVEIERDEGGKPTKIAGFAQDITDKKLAGIALETSEADYRNLFNNANAGIGRIGIDDAKVHFANQRMAEMFGYDNPEEFIAEYDFIKGYTNLNQRSALVANANSNSMQVNEQEFRKRDGSIITVLAHDRANLQGGWFDFIIVDITELVQTKEALREARDNLEQLVHEKTANLQKSEERFRDFAESAADWLWETDPGHKIIWQSQDRGDPTSLDFTDVEGKARWEIQGPHQGDVDFWGRLMSMMDNHQPFKNFDFPIFTPGGSPGHVRISGVPIFAANDKFAGYRGTGSDITQQTADQKALADSTEKLQQLVKIAKVGYFVWDEVNDKAASCTEEFANIFGCTADEYVDAVDTLDALLGMVHPDDRKHFAATIDKAHVEKRRYVSDYRIITYDGRTRDVQEISDFTFDNDGKIIETVGALQDVTDLKAMDRMKSEFISTVSHELRTPLTSIMGSLGLVRGGALGTVPDKIRSMVEIAYENSDRLIKLVNDILDTEKLDSGEMMLHITPLNITALVDEAISVNVGYGDEFGVTFARTSSEEMALVDGDSDRLAQVLSNLMSNAAKFSPKGSQVELSVTRKEGFFCVDVKDFGSGIPEKYRESIFEKFAQADASNSRSNSGTGLGLSISKMIVELHGGTIGLNSEMNVGTTFFFTLPIRP